MSHDALNGFQCNLDLFQIPTLSVKWEDPDEYFISCINCINFKSSVSCHFLMKISFQTLHQWLVSAQCECVCVCLEDNFISTSAFIHKQKDHTVLKLSSVLHGCLHQLIKNQKANVDLQNKTSTKESERPFFFFCLIYFCCCLHRPGSVGFLCCNVVTLWQTLKALALSWPHHNSDSWQGGEVYAGPVERWAAS